jgi:hypothetical protein
VILLFCVVEEIGEEEEIRESEGDHMSRVISEQAR